MEQKTTIKAEAGKQDLLITRQFRLARGAAFSGVCPSPNLVAQWMGTRVLKLESRKHGSYQFETVDSHGKVVFSRERGNSRVRPGAENYPNF